MIFMTPWSREDLYAGPKKGKSAPLMEEKKKRGGGGGAGKQQKTA